MASSHGIRCGLRGKLALATLIPIGLLAGLELAIRVGGGLERPPEADPFVGFLGNVPLFWLDTSLPEAERVWRLTSSRAAKFFPVTVRAAKPARTFRIFCLGGSAAQGWPHAPRFAYPAYLQEILSANDPTHHYEVVNLGGHTYASYRIAGVLEEILHLDPDLVVVHSGNNEFLEKRYYRDAIKRPWAHRLSSVLGHLHVYRLVEKVERRLRDSLGSKDALGASPLDGDAGQAHRRQYALKETLELRRDPVQMQRLIEHYRYNLTRMQELCRESAVPLVFCTVPVNLKDWPPNHSLHRQDLSPSEAARCDAWLEAAEKAATPQETLEACERALAIDDGFAGAHYLQGQALLALGEQAAAKPAFERARDEDQLPFRALGAMNAVVRRLGEELPVAVLDLEMIFANEAAFGIPGDDLFIDYVHPTMRANQLIARRLARLLVDRGLLPAATTTPPEEVPLLDDSSYYENDVTFLRALGFLYLEFGRYDRARAKYARLLELPLDPQDRALFELCISKLDAQLSSPRSGELSDAFKEFLEAIVFGSSEFRREYLKRELGR
ncbi:MAG: SGNH/GDSL hydrolase family protein [Planctomycetota bacterium]